jgi:hypothetical protein
MSQRASKARANKHGFTVSSDCTGSRSGRSSSILRRRLVVRIDVLQHLLEVELVNPVAANRAKAVVLAALLKRVTGYFSGGGFFRWRAMR